LYEEVLVWVAEGRREKFPRRREGFEKEKVGGIRREWK
jgi:hypothetical protein